MGGSKTGDPQSQRMSYLRDSKTTHEDVITTLLTLGSLFAAFKMLVVPFSAGSSMSLTLSYSQGDQLLLSLVCSFHEPISAHLESREERRSGVRYGIHALYSLIEGAIFCELFDDDELDVLSVLGVCERRTSAPSFLLGSYVLTLLEPGVGFGLRANSTANWRVTVVS